MLNSEAIGEVLGLCQRHIYSKWLFTKNFDLQISQHGKGTCRGTFYVRFTMRLQMSMIQFKVASLHEFQSFAFLPSEPLSWVDPHTQLHNIGFGTHSDHSTIMSHISCTSWEAMHF